MYIGFPFNAFDVNVKGNMYVSGIPSLTSIAGFAGAIEHHLKQNLDLEGDINVSAALLMNGMDVHVGVGSDIRYRLEDDVKEVMANASLNDRQTASISGYYIINIECSDLDDEEEVDYWCRGAESKRFLSRMRFAGGTMSIQFNHFVAEESFENCLKNVLKRYDHRPVFILEDATHLVQEHQKENEDRLDTLMRLISFRRKTKTKEETDNQEEDKEVYLGHLVPVAKGFVPIEAPVLRPNVRRKDTPHVYAEPVIGVCRMRSLPSLLRLLVNDEELPNIFYRYPKISVNDGGAVVNSYSV